MSSENPTAPLRPVEAEGLGEEDGHLPAREGRVGALDPVTAPRGERRDSDGGEEYGLSGEARVGHGGLRLAF